MRKKFLHLAMALGLVTGLFVGAIAPAAAAPEEPGEGAIYFPWVPNDDSLAGIDGITGSVTVQNLEPFAVDVTLTDADGNELTSITLNPRASQTWTADQLGIEAPGAGVIATADWADVQDLFDAGVIVCDVVDEVSGTRGTPANTTDEIELDAEPTAVAIAGYRVGADFNWRYKNGTLYIDWSPSGAEPVAGENTYSVTLYYCGDVPEPRIAGVEKHTVGTAGARTNANTEIVDGYTAIPYQDLELAAGGGEVVLDAQSRWVLPIVQTNNNWNTEIVITNVSGANNSVNATFYAAGGQGFAGPSVALLSGQTLGPGESIVVDLREDAGFPEGEVGSVWIDATHAVVAAAFRNKPSTEMMLTTVAQPRYDNGADVRFGPLVFRDYNGWNTGINIANLSSKTNRVTVTYYNYAGNVVASDTVTIPALAMEYVYTPATGNFGIGENQITSARIEGTAPLAAAIDEVKYLEGQDQWHAMSYAAGSALVGGDAAPLANGRVLYESMLALPLVQKGNPATGYGDTSGINLFNPSGDAVTAAVQFLDSAGVPVAPTVDATDAEAPTTMPVPAGAGVTVYTLSQSEMTAGFLGSAVVGVVGDGALVGVSNNVNYEVAGDGSAVFNLAPTSFTNFGIGFTVDSEDENPVGTKHTITVTVEDAFGPVEGIAVKCDVTEGPNAEVAVMGGSTDTEGVATCTYTDANSAADNNVDTITVWVDLNGSGTQDPGEVRTVTKTWLGGDAQLTATVASVADGTATINVQLIDGFGDPIEGATVTCEVVDGPNADASVTVTGGTTDENGAATCTYTDANSDADNNVDTVEVTAADADGGVIATTTVDVAWQ